jgi:transmembrane sensor
LARAGQHIDAGFEQRNVERGLSALESRLTRRRRVVQGSFVTTTLLAACVLLIQWRAHENPPLTAARVNTRDGSVATLRGPQTLLTVTHDGADEVALELARGSAHFEVTPNPKRRYRVQAGPASVEVLGTAFDVTRTGEQARVVVDHGVVRVAWNGGAEILRAGESGTFPPPLAAAVPVPSWRSLAQAGKHEEAFGSLGKQTVEDLPGLLLAADAARLSGHPRDAARHLEHLVQHYPQSPHAPLAAFTLGRLSLYELKQTAAAARSFGRAYALDPKGPMAEDALAREAEAYHQAGDAQRSKRAAERYLERFPNGERRSELLGYTQP